MAEDEEEEPTSPEAEGVEILMPPEQIGGSWANFARVTHSPYEFTLDFIRIDFAAEPRKQGVVVARISMSPLFISQLIDALKSNWEAFAEKSLEIEVKGDGNAYPRDQG